MNQLYTCHKGLSPFLYSALRAEYNCGSNVNILQCGATEKDLKETVKPTDTLSKPTLILEVYEKWTKNHHEICTTIENKIRDGGMSKQKAKSLMTELVRQSQQSEGLTSH